MNIIEIIKHPEQLNKETLYDLRSLIALYPYYQTARLLMLKNLYLLHDPTFDEELRRADLQKQRQEATEKKQKERLDYALLAIRDNGCVISRKKLTEILMKKFGLTRQTVSSHISGWLKEQLLFESDGNIHASPDMALAF